MHEVSVPVVSDSRAKRAYQQSQAPKYLPSLMVAPGKKRKGPCFGDRGGPLFDCGSRTQVGIDSRYAVQKCAAQARYPEVFTEVNNPEIRNFIVWAAKR